MSGFTCPGCGQGTIEPRCIPGRLFRLRPAITAVELPEWLSLPTCDQCLDYSFTDAQGPILDAIAEYLYGSQRGGE